MALIMRPLPHWQFVLFSGVTALAFAIIILAFWAETAHWLLGLFLGINMIMLGVAMAKVSLPHKESAGPV
ncbi:integral membrane protein [Methyloglobulus morosus KoM1]|uniref:Integral membrane protein n=1 Tax=Methyloglobulus morosus KoM1 TaxID=1116472 RepID=V5C2N6_9GAMM|nr:integral membrane protein [Methyloglobulus morosus]ESS72722.1 integral membrane protein [Methyloglobulus morosus KoM1]